MRGFYFTDRFSLGAFLTRNSWKWMQWASIALATGAIILISLLTWQRLQAEQLLLDGNAQARQQSLATIISEHLSQVMDRGRRVAVVAESWLGGGRHDAELQLTNLLAIDPVFLSFSLYDSSFRRLYNSSLTDAGTPDRESLRNALQRSDMATTVVLPPPGVQEQRWAVPVLFPLANEGGTRKGFLLVTLDMGYFLSLYHHIDMGKSGAIHILAQDGTELAEARAEGLTHRRQRRRFEAFAAATRTTGASSFVGEVQGLGPHISSLRQVEHSPFIVVVSKELAEVRSLHARSGARVWASIAALAVILGLATWGFVRGLRRQQLFFSALVGADEDKRSLIAQLEAEKARALALASLDHLTGLHNRRMFNELAASHLEVARRSSKHYALIYLDLDRFKPINDSLGHHVGDLLLQEVAKRLKSMLRSADILGRMGGDEFALLLTGLDSAESVDAIAAKLQHRLSQPYLGLDGHEVQTSPSMGIAFFPRDGHDVASLCRNADSAMYMAKRRGRGGFCYYDAELRPQEDRSLRLQGELQQAIGKGQLILHFQPKVRLSDYSITGFEALVRWAHPELGLIHPGEFIPIAEETGLIVALGDWVMQACCAQQARWREQGAELVPLAFNLSPRQIDAGLPARVAELLLLHGLEAAHIEVEITESALAEPLDVAVQVLTALRHMGVMIALDDFGIGYSNLSQVRHLPISHLKIDRSFINEIRTSQHVNVIVTSIITLAHSLGLRVVAEGVELRDQLVQLKAAGCDEVQGYFLSRPVPAGQALELMRQPTLTPQ